MEITIRAGKRASYKWGVFDIRPESVHIVPCNLDGSVQSPHILHDGCVCEPKIIPITTACNMTIHSPVQ